MYVDCIMYISIMKLTLFMMPLHSIYLAVVKLGYSLIHCKYLHFNLCNEFLFFQIEKKNSSEHKWCYGFYECNHILNLFKDVLLNRIEQEYIFCDTNLVIDGPI